MLKYKVARLSEKGVDWSIRSNLAITTEVRKLCIMALL